MIIARSTLTAFVALLAITVCTTVINAQRQSYRGTFRAVQQLIQHIETSTNQLSHGLNEQNQSRAYGRGGLNVNLVQDLQVSVAELRIKFNRRVVTATDVQQVLDRAALIDRFMGRNVRDAMVLRNWESLRADLNQLANAFNQRGPRR